MKKTIFKTLSVLMLAIFISSCETDDSILDATQVQSKEMITDNATTKMRSLDDPFFKIDGFDGPYDVINGEYVPHIGTYVRVTAKNPFGFWKTSGCFKQVGVRFLRTNKEKGSITHYVKRAEGGFSSVGRNFIAIPVVSPPPPPPPCPTSEHTKMRQSFSTYAAASNYDERYTYNWTVVNKGNTYHGTGSSIRLQGFGNFNVTLSIAQDGCTTQTRTQNFYVNIGR
ncbi:hypothetical protein ATO12_14500 [Aquimarina atlantica]|uniref:PKD domain-containing protein n=1 Tax=Aquimarina atlantica TaxID=1317122 RepID=A0A023BVN7_9FLAO|nr:hypothetical protein [Aquimarina atlantica]EZH74082.1 hypothetical protein ATO12_14500 [Aquimarina atlantica]